MGTKLNYQLPIFGKVVIELRNESAFVYEWLTSNPEMRRLKNMKQLGFLERKYPSAHHSKQEYAYLLIHLIKLVHHEKSLKKKFAISRPVIIKKEKLCSSIAELLKCWAFLLQIGHLHGTFPSEKAMLREILSTERNKNNFLDRFRSLNEYPKIEKIVIGQDYYRISYVFLIWKLLKIKKNKRGDQRKAINKLLSIALLYLNSEHKSIVSAKKIYRMLHRIAFVLLDSYYCDSIFCFNQRRMTSDTIISSMSKGKHENNLLRLWNNLENYLTQELYKNPQSVFIENLAYRALLTSGHKGHSSINTLLGNCLHYVNSQYEEKTFDRYLKKYNISLNQELLYSEHLLLSLIGLDMFSLELSVDKIRQIINKKSDYLNFDISKNQLTNNCEVRIFLKDVSINIHVIKKLLPFLLKSSLKSHRNFKSRYSGKILKVFKIISGPFGFPNDENFSSLILFILNVILKDEYVLVKKQIHNSFSSFVYDARTKPFNFKDSGDKGKSQELEDMFNLASDIYKKNKKRKGNSKIICLPFNIDIEDNEKNRSLTDIDSIIVNFNSKSKVDLFLLQSKSGKQSYSKAEKQAKKIINVLKTRLTSNIYPLLSNKKTAITKICIVK